MANVQFFYGQQSGYNSAVKVEDALYFITDTQRIYKGSTLIVQTNVVFTTTEPQFDTSETGYLYVYTDTSGSTTILTKGENSMETVGGGTVQPGAISDLNAFDSSLLVTSSELTSGELPDNDTSIPTSGAVKDAIEAAIQGVTDTITALGDPVTGASAERNGTNNGTVITLTRASGTNPITVNVSDLFLTSAEYDSVTHTLKLYVQGVTDPVEVDLADLIPQAMTTEDVAIAQPITMTVNVGNFTAGTELITSGSPTENQILVTDMQDLLEKMFSQDINPTTTQPSASITLSNSGAKEVGTQFTPSYSASLNPGSYTISYGSGQTRTQPTEVTATSYSVTDTNSGSASTQTGSFTAFTVDDDTNYRVNVTIQHSAGAIPETFLGNEYPAGQIQAGSKSAQSSNVTGYRNCWYGYKASGSEFDNITALTSTDIKTLTATRNRPTTISATNASQLVFAIPASQNMQPTINQVSPPVTVDVTGTYQINIGGVSDYSPIAYDIYYVNFSVPASGATQYNITWISK